MKQRHCFECLQYHLSSPLEHGVQVNALGEESQIKRFQTSGSPAFEKTSFAFMVQTETTLLSQTEYLAALLSSIDDSVVATDENFVIQYWNKKAEQLFGYPVADVVGQPGQRFLRFIYNNATRDESLQQLVDMGVWKGKVHFRSKNGMLRLLDVSVTVVRNQSGKTIGYVGVHRDITGQDKAQTSLLTFLSLISLTEDYFFIVDKDLRLAFVDDEINRRLKDIYGYTFSSGENVLRKLPAERRDQIRHCFEKAFSGEKAQYEVPVTTASGKDIWLQATYFPVRDASGVITHACSLVKNITPQKQMEVINDMLYRSRMLFETFMENSPIMSWITDKNGMIKYLNPAYKKNYRLTKDVIGQPLSVVYSPSVASALKENDTIVLQLNKPLKFIESSITPDGVERTYQVIKFPLQTEEGVFVGAWAIDITDENELRRTLSDSLVKLKNSERHLKEALAKELHLNEMKSSFVSMASHEFRTPLSTILSSVYLLEKYTTTEQQPNRMKHTQKMKNSIQHLNSLLDDFLTLGKLDDGKTVAHNNDFDLMQMLQETLEELDMFKKSGQVIQFTFSGSEHVSTDKKFLKNILINLLSNAIKFSAEDKQIHLDVAVENNQVSLSVRDEGIGISETDQENLFQTFFRGRNAQNIQGTGLGLNIVKRYVDLLHGTIDLKSELNKGTKVSIAIPITQLEPI